MKRAVPPRGEKNFPRLDIGLWITVENADRPRLHVVEKTLLEASGGGPEGAPTQYKGWDYGGNFDYNWAAAPHRPTWSISHHKQTPILFFEAYQTRRACGWDLSNCTACMVNLAVTRV